MPEGVDISEHQGVWSPDQFAMFDYAILRAFNENGYRDKVIDQTWANAKGQTLRGVYGWPIPGGNNFELGAQLVREFPDAEAGYWADREVSGRGVASADEVENYLRGIESLGGKAGFYSNIGECVFSPYLDAHDWWMADYGPNNGARHNPFDQPPVPSRPYTIHQYSSAGGLDRNWSDTLDWTGQPVPPAPTLPAFSLTGESAMSFASAVTPSAGVYETYRIDSAGTVQQWYFPRASDLEHADVATGGTPGGDVQIIRQTTPAGKVGRGDVWFERPDGTLGHAFQHGNGDWTWNVDTLGW